MTAPALASSTQAAFPHMRADYHDYDPAAWHYYDKLAKYRENAQIDGVPVRIFTRSEINTSIEPISPEERAIGERYVANIKKHRKLKKIRQEMNALGRTADGERLSDVHPRIVPSLYEMLYTTLKEGRIEQLPSILLRSHYKREGHYAHQTAPENYVPPLGCIIPMPDKAFSPAHWIKRMTGLDVDAGNLPGHAEHWHYFLLSHELNSCSGADEGQAYRLATADYIRTYHDITVPLAWADMFAVSTVLGDPTGSVHHHHGTSNYGFVQPLEIDREIRAKLESGAPSVKASDLSRIKFHERDTHMDSLIAFVDALKDRAPKALDTREPASLKKATEQYLDSKQGNIKTRYIAERFLAGLKRLTGEKTYDSYPAVTALPGTQKAKRAQAYGPK